MQFSLRICLNKFATYKKRVISLQEALHTRSVQAPTKRSIMLVIASIAVP